MTFAVIPTWTAWQQINDPQYLRWRNYTLVPVNIFPVASLPPIRWAWPPKGGQSLHLHLLPLGQEQALRLPPHDIILGDSGRILHSEPATGFLWVDDTIPVMLHAHCLLYYACAFGTRAAWNDLYVYVNLRNTAPPSIPILWKVKLAVGDARPGRVVESVNLDTEIRIYAVLQNILGADAYSVLFRARVLSGDVDDDAQMCLIKIPVDFLAPKLSDLSGFYTDDLQQTIDVHTADIKRRGSARTKLLDKTRMSASTLAEACSILPEPTGSYALEISEASSLSSSDDMCEVIIQTQNVDGRGNGRRNPIIPAIEQPYGHIQCRIQIETEISVLSSD